MPPDAQIQVVINGDAVGLAAGSTVGDLLERLGLPRDRLAVELNLEVIPRVEHATRCLRDGDRLEVVTFVGGG